MKFTGERYVPAEGWASIAYEHLSRYLMALPHARDRRVLDIGSGEGYGAHLLASAAYDVLGIDLSEEAVAHARARYGHERRNLRYVAGSATQLPIASARFDLVTCFEMLEHVDAHDALLAEIRRVLRPGGLLLLSTPNKHAYSDVPGYRNEFHVRELYFDEFRALAAKHFVGVAYFSQKNVTGSLIGPVDERRPARLSIRRIRRANEHNEFEPAGVESIDHLYYIAACSDDPAAVEAVGGVVVTDRDERLAREGAEIESARRDGRERELRETLEIRDRLDALRREADECAAAALRALGSARAERLSPVEPETGNYTLVVSSHGSVEELRVCLASLASTTDGRHPIVVQALATEGLDLVRDLAPRAVRVRPVRSAEELRSHANAALRAAPGDVVLVDASARFAPGWLARLERCARSDSRIGAAAPFGAGIGGLVPVAMRWSAMATPEARAAAVAATALYRRPRAPAVSSACMLLARRAIAAAGGYDKAIAHPWLADVDLCQRLWERGFEVALADDAYVERAGDNDTAPTDDEEATVEGRWPLYARARLGWCLMNPLRAQLLAVEELAAPRCAPRVLHVAGGSDAPALAAVAACAEAASHDLLVPGELPPEFDLDVGATNAHLRLLTANRLAMPAATSNACDEPAPLIEGLFAQILVGTGAVVVHLHDVAALGSSRLAAVARALGARVVVDVRPDRLPTLADRLAVAAADALCIETSEMRAVARSYGDGATAKLSREALPALYARLSRSQDAASAVVRARMAAQADAKAA